MYKVVRTMWKVLAVSCFTLVLTAPADYLNFAPINDFALKLLDNTYAYQENFGTKNVAISPVSVWSIFALLAEGSSGETFMELMSTLRLPNDLRGTQNLHRAVNAVLRSGNKDVVLSQQSAMFADCSLEVHQEFCGAATSYNTDIYSVDASNTTKLADDINYYICIATNGRIQNIVKPDLLAGLRMIIVDALYFKAIWKYPFDPTQTKEESFYDSLGRQIGAVNMMYQKGPFIIGESAQINAQILELPYGNNEDFSMIFLLPFDGMPIKKLINNLGSASLDWMTEFRSQGNLPSVDVYIPRFRMSTQTDLIPPLQYSGIRAIFDSQTAKLPGVSDNPLYVSKTVQNVEVEVSEEGTTAASATVVGVQDRFLGQRFEANREFVFLIVHKKSNVILFAGVYGEPSLV